MHHAQSRKPTRRLLLLAVALVPGALAAAPATAGGAPAIDTRQHPRVRVEQVRTFSTPDGLLVTGRLAPRGRNHGYLPERVRIELTDAEGRPLAATRAAARLVPHPGTRHRFRFTRLVPAAAGAHTVHVGYGAVAR